MKPRNLLILLISILILSVLFLPVLMGTEIIDVADEDDLADEDEFSTLNSFSVDWAITPVYQASAVLRLGISIFALFVAYLGGRSKHKRFNDRTIDPINVLTAESLKTALIRAVFNFLFLSTPIPNFKEVQK